MSSAKSFALTNAHAASAARLRRKARWRQELGQGLHKRSGQREISWAPWRRTSAVATSSGECAGCERATKVIVHRDTSAHAEGAQLLEDKPCPRKEMRSCEAKLVMTSSKTGTATSSQKRYGMDILKGLQSTTSAIGSPCILPSGAGPRVLPPSAMDTRSS